ncbi:MAG: hypothetical protein C4308_08625 [Chitinophagaceae bacterium]
MRLTKLMKNTFFIFLVFCSFSSYGQDWKNWNSLSVDLAFSKKLELGLSHLRSYNINDGYSNGFNQTSIDASYDFTKHFSVKTGFALTGFAADAVVSQKYFGRATYKISFADAVNWNNGLQGEMHTASGKGNSYRIIYITRFGLKHRMSFLNLSPSIAYWLFYNIGGNAIQYYDESGSPLVKESPDGLHRGRFIWNLNSKINKNLSLSLFYMNQHQFNLLGNDINVVNPGTGKVTRPFKNYQVAGGLSLSLAFICTKNPKK